MKELRKLRERYDFSFDSRQLGLILLAVAAVASLVFVLGISVGRQWERKTADGKHGAPVKGAQAKTQPAAQPVAPAAPPVVHPVLRPATTASAHPGKAKEESKTQPESLTFPKVLTSNSKKTAPLAKEDSSSSKKTASPVKEEPAGGSFTVQVGAYKTKAAAQASADRLKKKGYEARVYDSGAQAGPYHYKLRVGSYSSREPAKAAATKLKSEHFTPFVTREE